MKPICSDLEKNITKIIRKIPISMWRTMWKLGKEDPRRVIHGLKMGTALSMVSLLYLLEPLFDGVGKNAMWAVMTVVVVLEFTAGATLCKGLNRGLGTLFAGSLAYIIEFVVEKSGKEFRAVFIGSSVFFVGFLATYLRFIPYIKKNYDYGMVIFLLTFNLITVSSYRVENVIHIARDRLYTIAIGCSICLVMSLLILPNWSGEDLHNSTAYKLDGLARSIEACVHEYFKDKDVEIPEEEAEASDDLIYRGYRAVLDSKSTDETLASFASWEPRFSKNCEKHPWHLYVKLGGVLRHFGYTTAALHGCLKSEIQTPRSVRSLFRDPCIRVAKEVSLSLTELASSIRNRRCFSHNVLSDHLHEALHDLDTAIKSQPKLFIGGHKSKKMIVNFKKENEIPTRGTLSSVKSDISASMRGLKNIKAADQELNISNERKQLRPTLSKVTITTLEFSEALPFAAFASLLVEIVARLDLVIEQIEELAVAANFKEYVEKNEVAIDVDCKENGREVHQHHLESQVGE